VFDAGGAVPFANDVPFQRELLSTKVVPVTPVAYSTRALLEPLVFDS